MRFSSRRRALCAAAVAVLCTFAPMSRLATAQAEDKLNLLFYGNSYMLVGVSVPFAVQKIAQAAGRLIPNVENAAVEAQALLYHRTQNTAVITNPQDFVPAPGFQWNYVVMQEFSTKPTHIGDPAGFRNDANLLFNLVRTQSPAVKPVLFQTWADGYGNTGSYPGNFANPTAMQNELSNNYELARQYIDQQRGTPGLTRVGRVGDAFALDNFQNFYIGDLHHENAQGTFLSALVLYGKIYNDDVSDIDFSAILGSVNLSSADAKHLASLADRVNNVPESGALAPLILTGGMLLRRRGPAGAQPQAPAR